MKNLLRRAAATAALACIVPAASANVLTFEDLGSGFAFFTSDYQGFTFGTNDIQTTAWFHSDEPSPFYLPHSGSVTVATDFRLYDNDQPFEDAQPIVSSTPIGFEGAWFSGGDQIYYKLYNGAALVFTSTPSTPLTAAPSFVSSGYAGAVTGIVVVGRQGFYVMDDLTYNTSPVPEVHTYVLMLAGLAGIGAAVRRRRQS